VNTAKTLDVINHSKWKEALKKQQQDTFILKCIENENPCFNSYLVSNKVEVYPFSQHSLEIIYLFINKRQSACSRFCKLELFKIFKRPRLYQFRAIAAMILIIQSGLKF